MRRPDQEKALRAALGRRGTSAGAAANTCAKAGAKAGAGAGASADADTGSVVAAAFGRTVEWHDTLASTQDRGRELAAEHAPEGTLVVADTQTAGRGREGAFWFSPPGQGLWVTFILYPTVPAGDVPALMLVAAEALRDCLVGDYGLAPTIKPPNDVLLDGRKLAGILAEGVSRAGQSHVDFVCLGIGVNLTTDLSEQLQGYATRLADHLAKPPTALDLLARLVPRLEALYRRGL